MVMEPDVQAFLERLIAATSYEKTLFNLVTSYKMRGNYYLKSKSSLTGKQVKTEKRFARTMANARKTGQASKIASSIYSQLPEGWKLHALFRTLTGTASRMLHAGKTPDEIEIALWKQLEEYGYQAEAFNNWSAEN